MIYHLPAKDKEDTLRALALLPDAAAAEAGTIDDTLAALIGSMEEGDGDAEEAQRPVTRSRLRGQHR